MRTGNRHTNRGVGMVEILVGMAIGAILIAGVVQIFISSKHAYRTNDAMARLQENGRFAVTMISRTVRMAGYMGCAGNSYDRVNVTVADADFLGDGDEGNLFTESTIIEGMDDVDEDNDLEARENTDVLTIRYASPNGSQISEKMDSGDSDIKIAGNPHGFGAKDILFVTNCEYADIFYANSVDASGSDATITHTSGNTSHTLSTEYDQNALMMRFEIVRYFIRDTGRDSAFGLPIYGLYRETLVDDTIQRQELLAGIENMQVLYGEDTDMDGEADTYEPADTADMENVVSVRVGLLVSSTEETLSSPDTDSYDVAGKTVNPDDDRRLRMEFSTTISIRNREVLSQEV